jgi:hypothetical protein
MEEEYRWIKEDHECPWDCGNEYFLSFKDEWVVYFGVNSKEAYLEIHHSSKNLFSTSLSGSKIDSRGEKENFLRYVDNLRNSSGLGENMVAFHCMLDLLKEEIHKKDLISKLAGRFTRPLPLLRDLTKKLLPARSS